MAIQSITTGPRQSNFELLRIIAMFLVLIVHADYNSLGELTKNDFINNPVSASTRLLFESISIVCVNLFILISGWFGIRARVKSFLNFYFQCIYFFGGIYLFFLLAGKSELSIGALINCLGFNNWFVMSYIGLYILSPLINSFLENSDKRRVGFLLLSFFSFQTICGWTGFARFFDFGYSTMSFIGIYMLGAYMRISVNEYKFLKKRRLNLLFYVAFVIIISLVCVVQEFSGIRLGVYSYINPLVIAGSAFLFLCFANLKIKNSKIINWIAKSAFAVFLLHTQTYFFEKIFKVTSRDIFASYDGFNCLVIMTVFLLAIFICAIIIDQPRRWIWNKLSRIFK